MSFPSANNGHKPDSRYRNLDVDDAVVLFIDHQVGTMLFGITDIDAVNLHNSTLELAEVAKLLDVPAVLTTSNPTAINGPLFADLTELLPDAPIINRTAINAWKDEAFVAAVEATGRKKLVMTALWTEVCLAFPSLDALRAGYEVFPVVDAVAGTSAEAHRAGLERIVQAGAQPISWVSLACELQRDWARTDTVADVVDIVLTSRLLKGL